jgi:NADH-quinone oxidoreductase subunit J
MELFVFVCATVMIIVGALGVVLRKHPVHAALSLVLTLFGIAVLFVAQHAEFLAAVQVIVYAGAIVVLFLFVIMLMNLNASTEPQKNNWLKLAGIIAGGCFLMVLLSLVKQANELNNIAVTMGTGEIGLIKNLGKALFNDFVVPFEISSVLFLSAMVGAVVIGKKA